MKTSTGLCLLALAASSSSTAVAQVARDTTRDSIPRLAPITVTAKMDRHLVDVGFYERRNANPGFFMDPGQVEKRRDRAEHFADLLTGIPGTYVQTAIVSPGGGTRVSIPRVRGMASLTRQCFVPRIFVDGMLITVSERDRDATRDIDQAVRPQDVLAIEIYRRPAEIPPQYSGSESGCGVILVWTK